MQNVPLKLLSAISKGGKPLTTSEFSDTDSDADTMSAPDNDPVNHIHPQVPHIYPRQHIWFQKTPA